MYLSELLSEHLFKQLKQNALSHSGTQAAETARILHSVIQQRLFVKLEKIAALIQEPLSAFKTDLPIEQWLLNEFTGYQLTMDEFDQYSFVYRHLDGQHVFYLIQAPNTKGNCIIEYISFTEQRILSNYLVMSFRNSPDRGLFMEKLTRCFAMQDTLVVAAGSCYDAIHFNRVTAVRSNPIQLKWYTAASYNPPSETL
ncbi:MAG: hypothetical protein [Bacteriophage sp.]|nr:MAG: hypothetical protein [Bacteriophage sp.]